MPTMPPGGGMDYPINRSTRRLGLDIAPGLFMNQRRLTPGFELKRGRVYIRFIGTHRHDMIDAPVEAWECGQACVITQWPRSEPHPPIPPLRRGRYLPTMLSVQGSSKLASFFCIVSTDAKR
jgi:hypothetical protein